MYDKLAQKLFGAKRAESDSVLTDATTNTIHGTATSASADGSVMVELSSDVTNPEPIEIDGETYYSDADTSVELPTTTSVQEGDEVLVSVYGGTPLRSPVVTGVVGSGDRVAGMAQDAYDLADSVEGIAQQALDVANATGQHFWSDTDGAHVTEVTQEEWTDPTDPGYQSGPNSLWNSLGMLFRYGLNNLLANLAGSVKTVTLTATEDYQNTFNLPDTASRVMSVSFAGVSVSNFILEYNDDGTSKVRTIGEPRAQEGDEVVITYRVSPAFTVFNGEGNSASDIVANFTAGCIDLGKNTASAIIRLIDGLGIIKADAYGLRIESPRGTNLFAGEVGGQFARIGGSVGIAAGAGLSVYDPTSPGGTINVDFTSAGSGNTLYISSDGISETMKMEQVICALQQPMGSWSGASGTTKATAAGWRLTYFNVAFAGADTTGDYLTQNNGVIRAQKNIRVMVTAAMNWNDNIAGQLGVGFFYGGTAGQFNGTEYSTFQYFPSGYSGRKTVVMPPTMFNLAAGTTLTIGRFDQVNSVYQNGTNYSRLTIQVLGVY